MTSVKRIHIVGASGSGTSTLGNHLSNRLGFKHLDTDDFYWEPTTPKYQQSRPVERRLDLLEKAFDKNDKWILSGSLCGWGDVLIPKFDLVIFIRLEPSVRLERLKNRERQRYGDAIEEGGTRHADHKVFIDWASQYDEGDETVRSLKLHNTWLKDVPCKVLRIEEDITIDEKIERVLAIL